MSDNAFLILSVTAAFFVGAAIAAVLAFGLVMVVG